MFYRNFLCVFILAKLKYVNKNMVQFLLHVCYFQAKYDEEIVRMSAALASFQFFKDLGPWHLPKDPVRSPTSPHNLPRSPSRLSAMRQELNVLTKKMESRRTEDDCEERQSIVETVEQSFYKRGSGNFVLFSCSHELTVQ